METNKNHTKGEWAIRNLEIIGPYGSNKSICEITGNYMDEDEAVCNMHRIVECVNGYDALQDENKRLKENLARIIDRIEEGGFQLTFPSAYYRAKECLNTTINGK